jgi:epoxyqueuosine reductase
MGTGLPLTRADREWIEQRARAAGFDLAGVAAVPEPSSTPASGDDQRYTQWIDAGFAGEMEYLKRADAAGEYLRGDLRRSMPWARSVIVCAVNYNAAAPKSIDPADSKAGWIARYAWSGQEQSGAGSDYHDVLLHQLRALESELKERFGTDASLRCYVDTGPLAERSYAARAGVGWIGKNTCVLNQQQGSWLLLGVIVTSLGLEPEAWSVPAASMPARRTRCSIRTPPAFGRWMPPAASRISRSRRREALPRSCARSWAGRCLAATSARMSVPGTGVRQSIRRVFFQRGTS